MAVVLEGGCRMSEMREGDPFVRGSLKLWPQVDRVHGARAISLRVLEFAPGLSPGITNAECDEILYLPEEGNSGGPATIFIDGWSYHVAAGTGIYVRPGETFAIDNPTPHSIVLISSQCPEPDSAPVLVPAQTAPASGSTRPNQPPLVRLSDRAAVTTADRWYSVLVDDELGSTQATQFVGSIPPGRAPDHFHEYEEVLFILRGEGRMWAGESNTPIAAGSCIYLPRGQVHCVENTGTDELRLLGVFYPAGSPSVRYEV